MAKKDNTGLAWGIGLGTLALAGVAVYFYEKSQPAAPTTTPGPVATLPPVGVNAQAPGLSATTQNACAMAQKLVAMRQAFPNQDPSVIQKPYTYWANLCTQGGGTPPAWPG